MTLGVNLDKVLIGFYQHQLLIKTLHFQSASGFLHTRLDAHLLAFAPLMDEFMEVAQGIKGERISLDSLELKVSTLKDSTLDKYLETFMSEIQKIHKDSQGYPSLQSVLDAIHALCGRMRYLGTFK